jgi:SAM-dependent methyltransferase
MIKKMIRYILRYYGYEIIPYKAKIGAEANKSKSAAVIFPYVPYIERPEYGASNIQTKLENLSKGLPFEFPDMLNLNNAVATLIGDASRIVELGSGTGNFATAAVQHSKCNVVASEFDKATHEWVKENKPHPNIEYHHGPLSADCPKFDLVVSVDVIEHIADYRSFLIECVRLADRALITTPNRSRDEQNYHCGPPVYYKHVREWTAGEFYWVLRLFYKNVKLYGMTSQTEPKYVPVDIDTRLSGLIADCNMPYEL